jgi:hypothetical protein
MIHLNLFLRLRIPQGSGTHYACKFVTCADDHRRLESGVFTEVGITEVIVVHLKTSLLKQNSPETIRRILLLLPVFHHVL